MHQFTRFVKPMRNSDLTGERDRGLNLAFKSDFDLIHPLLGVGLRRIVTGYRVRSGNKCCRFTTHNRSMTIIR